MTRMEEQGKSNDLAADGDGSIFFFPWKVQLRHNRMLSHRTLHRQTLHSDIQHSKTTKNINCMAALRDVRCRNTEHTNDTAK